jgi:hypothetical protein
MVFYTGTWAPTSGWPIRHGGRGVKQNPRHGVTRVTGWRWRLSFWGEDSLSL